ncbi:CoA pyrophosphatase [Inmirania thermothiophila]|uniref:8-oxo-dGTP pyrophosphatase MutT (NUDIX family) n=1 Tax=Inmirania thermothiophila TaxID=1750597 RepID=A0A3N1Y1X7_9GAMM|nr:CoA pyrophosphatase [Inmirania thermothiophila]ROR32826.1 8-oxo-dGTP pyrophosphatase MutT (NUDIX family) [Inmirania thermothiophila]
METDTLICRLRRAVAGPPGEAGGDHRLDPGLAPRAPAVAAAVLVPVLRRPAPTVLLTRRTDHLHDHAGQVSLPGGRCEPGDPHPEATALRESEEEIGLAPGAVEILGRLERYETVTGFAITPVLALVDGGFVPRPDPFEVAEVFEVPLAQVLDPAAYRLERREVAGRRRTFRVLPHPRHFIWGATAGILYRLACRCADAAAGV